MPLFQCTNRKLRSFDRWLLADNSVELFDHLFDLLEVGDLHSLARSSFAVYRLFRWYRKRKWSLNSFVGLWATRPDVFLRALRLAGGVISGSQALRFMDRQPASPSSDLDVFMRVGGMPTFRKMLSDGGYTIRPRNRRTLRGVGGQGIRDLESHIQSLIKTRRFRKTLGRRSIVGVYDCLKAAPGVDGKPSSILNVQIILVNTDPARFILEDFHSTAIMNLITGRCAVSIFPRTTFLHRLSFAARRTDGPKPSTWVEKYQRRGFEVVRQVEYPLPLHMREGLQHIGDGECWLIEFAREPEDDDSECIYGKTDLRSVYFRVAFAADVEEGNSRLSISSPWPHRDCSTSDLLSLCGYTDPESGCD